MKIASYNSHRSAPFLRALVERTTKFTRSKGADAVIPSASLPASCERESKRRLQSPADPKVRYIAVAAICSPRVIVALGGIALVRCRQRRRRYLVQIATIKLEFHTRSDMIRSLAHSTRSLNRTRIMRARVKMGANL